MATRAVLKTAKGESPLGFKSSLLRHNSLAKLVRHEPLKLKFLGSNPRGIAKIVLSSNGLGNEIFTLEIRVRLSMGLPKIWKVGTVATAVDCKSTPKGTMVRVHYLPPYACLVQWKNNRLVSSRQRFDSSSRHHIKSPYRAYFI